MFSKGANLSWKARCRARGATPVSRTLQRSWNQHCDGPNRRRRARSQSPACMCMSAPLPGYRSTTPTVPARSPAVAVDLFVALGGRLVQMRGGQPGPPGPWGPRRGRSVRPTPLPSQSALEVKQAYARPQAHNEMQPTPPMPVTVRLDRLPKDHARRATAGIVGQHRNSIAIGFAEELHAKAFVKCDGLQI